jgi:hypothetical protein
MHAEGGQPTGDNWQQLSEDACINDLVHNFIPSRWNVSRKLGQGRCVKPGFSAASLLHHGARHLSMKGGRIPLSARQGNVIFACGFQLWYCVPYGGPGEWCCAEGCEGKPRLIPALRM